MKMQAEIDLTKTLIRGMMLKYKQTQCWVKFKYESLPLFYFYCGTIRHNKNFIQKGSRILSKIRSDQTSMEYGCELETERVILGDIEKLGLGRVVLKTMGHLILGEKWVLRDSRGTRRCGIVMEGIGKTEVMEEVDMKGLSV